MRTLITIAILFLQTLVQAQTYDVIIRNGKIIDGTGNPWYHGDVAIHRGKIVAVGKVVGAASRTINATGLIVAPGFIDVHTHIEGNDLRVPTSPNFIMDGVTSVVTGNCGGSNTDVAKYFRQLDSVKTSINIATLIGHNSVRSAVMGNSRRDPTTGEQQAMEALVESAMRAG